MDVYTLISANAATITGNPVKIGDYRLINGAIPFLIYGEDATITATINIQGTVATDAEVSAGTAKFITIDGGSFTSQAATALIAQFSHIRAQISSYSAGTISVRMLL